MAKLGNNVKITAPEAARKQARATFEVLGAKLLEPNDRTDVFALGDSNIGFEYIADADALTVSQMRIAPWLELAVDDVAAISARLVERGCERLDYRDKEHPYFIGPAGVVFRLTALARP